MTPPWGLPALCRGGVAQNWLEQALYKGQVVGSSPTAPTTSLRRQGLAAVKLPGSPRDHETENRGNSSRAAPC